MRSTLMVAFLLVIATVTAPAQSALSTPDIISSYDLVSPTGVVHIEEMEIEGHRQIHCMVTTNDGSSADATFDARGTTLSDGYRITRTTLSNTQASLVTRLVATDPQGGTATAITGRNKTTGETTFAGIENYAAVLRGSNAVRIINRVLPMAVGLYDVVQTRSSGPGSSTPDGGGANVSPQGVSARLQAAVQNAPRHLRPAPTTCIGNAILYFSAELAAGATCIQSVGVTCVALLGAMTGAYIEMTDQCGTTYTDTTGWA